MFKKILIAAALTAAGSANAAIVTQWNFNSTTPDSNTGTGVTTPSVGSGTASLIGGVTGSFSSGDASGGSSDPATGDDSGWQTTTYTAQGTGNKTRGTQYNVSTLGFTNIFVNYDLRHSNTSSRYEQFQYSLDGTNFIDSTLFDGPSGDTWFNNRSIDLSSITGASNNASFAFRIVSAFAPSTSAYSPSNTAPPPNDSNYLSTGTWRFDMVTVQGTAVPAAVPLPAALPLLLAGLGLMGFVGRRKKFN